MAKIEVSAATVKEFERLKKELKTIYAEKEITNDEVVGAMIGGFFDSLAHMKAHVQEHTHGHDHGDGECCGHCH